MIVNWLSGVKVAFGVVNDCSTDNGELLARASVAVTVSVYGVFGCKLFKVTDCSLFADAFSADCSTDCSLFAAVFSVAVSPLVVGEIETLYVT